MGREHDEFVLPENVSNVAELIDFIKRTDSVFEEVFESAPKVLVAVNQVVVSKDCQLSKNDEIAFFPPMTGG